MNIQAIETVYNGYRFRSRLEARWAVFFDVLGLRYEYEAQDYIVGGVRYLPDFKLILPNDEIVFVEVKAAEVDDHRGRHVDLCRGLALLTGKDVLLVPGAPACRMYHVFTKWLPADGFSLAFFQDYDPWIKNGFADHDYWLTVATFNENTGVQEFLFDDRRMRKAFGERLVWAIAAAQQARFEHGESGPPKRK